VIKIISKSIDGKFMKQRQTFSIDFITRLCKADRKRADIYARITVYGGLPKEISINEQIDAYDWLSDKEMVKGKGIEVKSIYEKIDDVRFLIKQKYRELERTEQIITAQTVKNSYRGSQANLKGHTLRELTKFADESSLNCPAGAIWSVVILSPNTNRALALCMSDIGLASSEIV
jgi:hypothetical protein